jgi:hypothetical protein
MCEDDLRWTANLALGAAFVVAFAGVIFGQYLSEEFRGYIVVASLFVSGVFAGFGLVLHWNVKKKIRRTTIFRLGRWK